MVLIHKLALFSCLLFSPLLQAQSAAEPCAGYSESKIRFSSLLAEDTLSVSVKGEPCSKATVTIQVTNSAGESLYRYQGAFIEHMPFMIYEPELNKLVDFYVNRVMTDATSRNTRDLPPYSNLDEYYEATNDFVVIPISEYNQLRQQNHPILWHTTGDSTWVDVIYDDASHSSKIIIRGGIFQASNH